MMMNYKKKEARVGKKIISTAGGTGVGSSVGPVAQYVAPGGWRLAVITPRRANRAAAMGF